MKSPYGEYELVSEYSDYAVPSVVVVLSLDSNLQFPFELSLRSLRHHNSSVKDFLVFITEGCTLEAKLDAELQGCNVFKVRCKLVGPRPALGPKTCVYFAAKVFTAKRFLFMDLDTITLRNLGWWLTANADKDLIVVAETLDWKSDDLFYHCFREDGIYRGYLYQYAAHKFDRFRRAMDKTADLMNTGVMSASYTAMLDIAKSLEVIAAACGSWLTDNSTGRDEFIGHREQALFDLAVRNSSVHWVIEQGGMNCQLLTSVIEQRADFIWSKTHDCLVSVLHFNGYHAPHSPSRKALEEMLASNPLIRQFA